MVPTLAWDDMVEVNLSDTHKSRDYEDRDPRFEPNTTRQRQYKNFQQLNHNNLILQNTNSNTKRISKDTTYLNGYNFKHGQQETLDQRYSREMIWQKNDGNPQSLAYPPKQVNLIDFIGGSQSLQQGDIADHSLNEGVAFMK